MQTQIKLSLYPELFSQVGMVTIRGVQLSLNELVNPIWFESDQLFALRDKMLKAQPFPHLVLKDVFNPALLELVEQEFAELSPEHWINVKSKYESTYRSALGAPLGPAAQLYFSVVHSPWFMRWLSALIDVSYLLPDPLLKGGGLHESRTGSSFSVHRDFQFHSLTGLRNEMVLITYLNKAWLSEWDAALELWDGRRGECITKIEPEFGNVLIMPHGQNSYHGHPSPMRSPPDRPRRSVTTYYYSSPLAGRPAQAENRSIFLNTTVWDQTKNLVSAITPPLVWKLARTLLKH